MKTKEKLYILFLLIIFAISIFIYIIFSKNKTYAKENNTNTSNVRISNAKKVDIYEIIKKNTVEKQEETIETIEEPLEFITKYKTNADLPRGTIQVIQEGREGIQQISIKRIYQNGNLIDEQQMGVKVKKASIDKIVEIGGAKYTSSYKVKKGDSVYTTADRTEIMFEPNAESTKLTTIGKNNEFKILDLNDDWYKVSGTAGTGWIKKESTTYINPNKGFDEVKYGTKDKQELIKGLSFDMKLNKPSGLTLEQFKKILSDSKDVNKTFENNAEYFYYIEKQYNINGVFVAALGIHESAWGTSKIARDKKNLFGYGAYDSNPYGRAYSFENYSEGIDLIARVLTKYYLNPAGTSIYNSEKASGSYYNGPTLSGINTRYATDKNWANGVYSHMKYLYNKL